MSQDDSEEFCLWEGVYSTQYHALENRRNFSNKLSKNSLSRYKWLEKQRYLLEEARAGKTHRTFSLLNILESNSNVRILDFGGGIGWGFPLVLENFPLVEYYIVETEDSVQTFSKYWRNEFPVFTSNYQTIKKRIDVIYVNSVLQYLISNEALVDLIEHFNPEKVIIDEIVASQSKEFFSLQNHWDTQIPYRFLNLNDLSIDIRSLGYSLASSSSAAVNIPSNVKWEIMDSDLELALPMNQIYVKKSI